MNVHCKLSALFPVCCNNVRIEDTFEKQNFEKSMRKTSKKTISSENISQPYLTIPSRSLKNTQMTCFAVGKSKSSSSNSNTNDTTPFTGFCLFVSAFAVISDTRVGASREFPIKKLSFFVLNMIFPLLILEQQLLFFVSSIQFKSQKIN